MRMIERHYDFLMRGIPAGTDVPAIDITEAARWFFEDSEKEIWDISEDFPCVVPPFPITWLEYSAPKVMNIGGDIRPVTGKVDGAGCMMMALEVAPEWGQAVIAMNTIGHEFESLAQAAGVSHTRGIGRAEWARRAGGALRKGHTAKWIVYMRIFAEYRKEIAQLSLVGLYLDSMGKVIPDLYQVAVSANLAGSREVGGGIPPFLFALSLAHAKNVDLIDTPIPPAVAKKRQKRNKPVVRFRTLKIQSMRAAANSREPAGKPTTKYAMHLCRGHFKDFREGPGLFGKHRGIYWWESQVRGDRSLGQVVKDYEIGKPS